MQRPSLSLNVLEKQLNILIDQLLLYYYTEQNECHQRKKCVQKVSSNGSEY